MIESTLISLKYHQQNYSLPHQMNPISNTTSMPNVNESNKNMLNKKMEPTTYVKRLRVYNKSILLSSHHLNRTSSNNSPRYYTAEI